MKHINYEAATRAERTGAEWLRVGANIAAQANQWANREDLVVFVGEGATEGLAPALFKPNVAEIEINVEQAFGFGVNPDSIGDFATTSTRYEFAKATGAILHEAFHARFSRWSMEKAYADLQSDEYAALLLLEEGRIEKQGLDLDSKHRPFLRACAMEIVLGEISAESLEHLTVAGAAQLVGLLNARVVSGILSADEVADATAIIRKHLGEDAFVRLLEIADAFQNHTNHYVIDASYPLAIEWAKIVRELAEERGEESEQGEGSGSGASLGDLLDILESIAGEVEIASNIELGDQQDAEEWEQQVKERANKSKETAEARKAANEVFEKLGKVFDDGDDEDTGKGTTATAGKTFSTLIEARPADSKERAAAVKIAQMLERAKYRDRDVTVIESAVPQGRLRPAAALQNAAFKARGQMATAKPWKQKVRKQTDEPTLNVGVMVDISGSMRSAMEPMAVTAWVMSEAVRRVQGKCAMVYYGQDVFATLKAGQHLDGVKVWSANDSTEKFDKAFKALDGSLNLLNGNGARLLVVVSDGVYTYQETAKAKEWVKRCEQEGVAVLWLTFEDYNSYAKSICNGTNAVVLSGRLNPADAAVEIGQAAAKALELSNASLAA